MLTKNKIYCGDVLDLFKDLPDESVDLVVTSPPYNLGSRYANQTAKAIQGKWDRVIQYDDYQDNMPEAEYREWQRKVIGECWRVIKPTGAIYYNHKPRIQKGSVWHRLDLIPTEANLRQIIIWNRPKGHNFNRGYYVPSYEWIFLLAKPEYRLTKGANGHSDVWDIAPSQGTPHPATFPLEIPKRAIAASENCQLVLDPFMGEGTTAVAAKQLGVDYIGFELIERWVTYAERRLQKL